MTETKHPKNLPPEIASEVTLDLSGHEGQFVEFKQAMTDLSREMVGFANAEGGRIYVGVADNQEIKGISINNRLLSQIQDMARKCDPSIAIKLYPFKREGKDLLLIQVSEGETKPYGCSDGYFLRTGPSSQKMNRNELLEFVHEQSPLPFEERVCKEFAFPEDFDQEAFRTFLRLAGMTVETLVSEDLLISLGLAKRKDSRLVVNNACVLFFAKKPVRFLPQARISCLLFQMPDRVHIMDSKDLEGGLLQNAEQAELFILSHLPVRFEIKGMDRINHHEIPIEVLREGIINSLMHRNYAVHGGNVSIEIFPNQVSIINPGGLPAALSPKDFGTMSIRRNQLIADIFHRADKVERAGSGINRIRSGLAKAKCPAPVFNFSSSFELILYRRFADTDQFQPITVAGEANGVSYDQVILQFCLIPRQLREIMGKTELRRRESMMEHLKPLIAKGLVAMTIPDKPKSRLQRYVTTLSGRDSLAGFQTATKPDKSDRTSQGKLQK